MVAWVNMRIDAGGLRVAQTSASRKVLRALARRGDEAEREDAARSSSSLSEACERFEDADDVPASRHRERALPRAVQPDARARLRSHVQREELMPVRVRRFEYRRFVSAVGELADVQVRDDDV